ncbi:hypothetical protein ACJDU8_13740 [Clostridium sp. WILCCON 0269]|uniref:Phage protein n=1 Tax=Candidatus Clostridium eludens TaxID=3381663 RepID=A0ABW8SKW2_9CLOT
MYWEVIKRQTKTGMYVDIVKAFEFNEETKEVVHNQALKYAKRKNRLDFMKKYYYEVEFNWK